MRLLTKEHVRQLKANGRWNNSLMTHRQPTHEFRPVVKLVCLRNWSTWLLSEISVKHVDLAFGLFICSCGTGNFGHISISRLESATKLPGSRFERDRRFKPTKSLNEYWLELQLRQRLTVEQKCLSPQCIIFRRRRHLCRPRSQEVSSEEKCTKEDDPAAFYLAQP